MSPEVRFALKLVRLMLGEGRVLEESVGFGTEDYRLITSNCTPAPGTVITVDYFGIVSILRAEQYHADTILQRFDIEWPATAHARMGAISRIDAALAGNEWPVQPTAEQEGLSA